MKAPGLSFDLDNMIWQSGAQRTPRAWQYACQDPNKWAECDSLLITSHKLDATSPHKFNS